MTEAPPEDSSVQEIQWEQSSADLTFQTVSETIDNPVSKGNEAFYPTAKQVKLKMDKINAEQAKRSEVLKMREERSKNLQSELRVIDTKLSDLYERRDACPEENKADHIAYMAEELKLTEEKFRIMDLLGQYQQEDLEQDNLFQNNLLTLTAEEMRVWRGHQALSKLRQEHKEQVQQEKERASKWKQAVLQINRRVSIASTSEFNSEFTKSADFQEVGSESFSEVDNGTNSPTSKSSAQRARRISIESFSTDVMLWKMARKKEEFIQGVESKWQQTSKEYYETQKRRKSKMKDLNRLWQDWQAARGGLLFVDNINSENSSSPQPPSQNPQDMLLQGEQLLKEMDELQTLLINDEKKRQEEAAAYQFQMQNDSNYKLSPDEKRVLRGMKALKEHNQSLSVNTTTSATKQHKDSKHLNSSLRRLSVTAKGLDSLPSSRSAHSGEGSPKSSRSAVLQKSPSDARSEADSSSMELSAENVQGLADSKPANESADDNISKEEPVQGQVGKNQQTSDEPDTTNKGEEEEEKKEEQKEENEKEVVSSTEGQHREDQHTEDQLIVLDSSSPTNNTDTKPVNSAKSITTRTKPNFFLIPISPDNNNFGQGYISEDGLLSHTAFPPTSCFPLLSSIVKPYTNYKAYLTQVKTESILYYMYNALIFPLMIFDL